MPIQINQQELADAIGYSQSRISTATKEGDSLCPDFMEEPFDPREPAVHKGGHFQGFDPERLPDPVRGRLQEEALGEAVDDHAPSSDTTSQGEQRTLLTVPTPDSTLPIRNPAQVFLPERAVEVGSRPAYAAAGRPVKTAGNQPGTSRLLSGNEVHLQREQTSVSVIPEGTDVSQSVAYGSAGHVTGTAVTLVSGLLGAAVTRSGQR